jgi:hypothetical protein
MRIAVVGRGNVGGGLADLWERAGHEVKRIGRQGDDVSEAEVVLLAVPGGAIAEALGKVEGIDGKTVIDATNLYGVVPPEGFPSNAEFVKSKTNGPTARLSCSTTWRASASPHHRLLGACASVAQPRVQKRVVSVERLRCRLRPRLHGAARECRNPGEFGHGHPRDRRGHRAVSLPDGATRAALILGCRSIVTYGSATKSTIVIPRLDPRYFVLGVAAGAILTLKRLGRR